MYKRQIKYLSIVVGISTGIILSEFILRLLGFHPMHIDFSTNPPNSVTKHSKLGWQFNQGCYKIVKNKQFNKPIPNSDFCIDKNLNRNIPLKQDTFADKIHLYGCSFAFGQSVSDTSNMGFYLQKMLPNYFVVNKGVSGYGLLQMFIKLKIDVEKNNKPFIAIFNYVSFHKERHPFHASWIKGLADQLKYSAEYDSAWKNDKAVYPYATIDKDSCIVVKNLNLKDLPNNCSLRYKSSLINLFQRNIDRVKEEKIKSHLEFLDYKIAIEIINFCKFHKIHLVFAGFDSDTKPLLEKLEMQGINTLYYNIDITLPEYNCSPLDPGHPSAKAHMRCALKIFKYLHEYHYL